jgi:hypothetical protein
MSVARSSAGGTVNNCCDPCSNSCRQSYTGKSIKQRASRNLKLTRGANSCSASATLVWNCGDEPTNSSELFGTRCADDRSSATWNCVPIIQVGATQGGAGCSCPGCDSAKNAAIIAANQAKPAARRETTTPNWVQQSPSSCPSLNCPGGPCYRAQKPYPKPNLPAEPLPNITWTC